VPARLIEEFQLAAETDRKVQDSAAVSAVASQVAKVFMVETPILFSTNFPLAWTPSEAPGHEPSPRRIEKGRTSSSPRKSQRSRRTLRRHPHPTKEKQIARGDLQTRYKCFRTASNEITMAFDHLPRNNSAELGRALIRFAHHRRQHTTSP